MGGINAALVRGREAGSIKSKGDFMDWKDRVKELQSQGVSLKEIARQLQPYFPDKTEHEVWEKVHSATRKKRDVASKPVGVFSDPHIPFNHPNYLQFIKDTFKKYHVGQVVCLGDLIDNHAISRHQTETCAQDTRKVLSSRYRSSTCRL